MTIDDILIQKTVDRTDTSISAYTLLENLKQCPFRMKVKDTVKRIRINENKVVSFSAFYDYHMMYITFLVKGSKKKDYYFYSTERILNSYNANYSSEINELFDLYEKYLKLMDYPKLKTYQEFSGNFYAMKIKFPFEEEPSIDFKLVNDKGDLIEVDSHCLDKVAKRIMINNKSLHMGFDYMLVQNESLKRIKRKMNLKFYN